MPTFVLNTDKIIEAQVQAFYPWEKTAKGLIELRWWAKKVRTMISHFHDITS